MAKQTLQVEELVERIFDEELKKLNAVFPEFEAKQIYLDLYRSLLEAEKAKALGKINHAIENANWPDCVGIMKESQEYTFAIRSVIDHISVQHLNKPYK